MPVQGKVVLLGLACSCVFLMVTNASQRACWSQFSLPLLKVGWLAFHGGGGQVTYEAGRQMEVALSPSPESWLPSDGIWEGQMAIEEADGGGL